MIHSGPSAVRATLAQCVCDKHANDAATGSALTIDAAAGPAPGYGFSEYGTLGELLLNLRRSISSLRSA
jgi:hypothetical protein